MNGRNPSIASRRFKFEWYDYAYVGAAVLWLGPAPWFFWGGTQWAFGRELVSRSACLGPKNRPMQRWGCRERGVGVPSDPFVELTPVKDFLFPRIVGSTRCLREF